MINDKLVTSFDQEYLVDRMVNTMLTSGVTLAKGASSAVDIKFSGNCAYRAGATEVAITAASDELDTATANAAYYKRNGEVYTSAPTVPAGGSAVFLICADGSKKLKAVLDDVSTEATGTFTIPLVPKAISNDVAALGYATLVNASSGAFTFGTTAFDATDVTTTFTAKKVLFGGESVEIA